MIHAIPELRRELHQYPELSGQEEHTATRIIDFLETNHSPNKIIKNIGGHGLVAIYEFSKSGKTVMIRCELDALPIEEENNFEYRSIHQGVSHKCGHDGHMAMVAGLVFWLKEQVFSTGSIILLFQPAEETGKGAFQMLQDEHFQQLEPDYVFALHNLPSYPLHTILVKNSSFSASVQSMIITLKGKKSHASEPENGINPAFAVAEMVSSFAQLNNKDTQSEDFAVLTPIHIHLGEKAYGISPEDAEIHYTIRTWSEVKMKTLEKVLSKKVENICKQQQLNFDIAWIEYFPTTENNNECYEVIKKVAKKNGLDLLEMKHPLKFGEDFGWFSQQYKSAMFGLGAGINHPALHHVDYDFPEEILETGMKMFQGIILEILE